MEYLPHTPLRRCQINSACIFAYGSTTCDFERGGATKPIIGSSWNNSAKTAWTCIRYRNVLVWLCWLFFVDYDVCYRLCHPAWSINLFNIFLWTHTHTHTHTDTHTHTQTAACAHGVMIEWGPQPREFSRGAIIIEPPESSSHVSCVYCTYTACSCESQQGSGQCCAIVRKQKAVPVQCKTWSS